MRKHLPFDGYFKVCNVVEAKVDESFDIGLAKMELQTLLLHVLAFA